MAGSRDQSLVREPWLQAEMSELAIEALPRHGHFRADANPLVQVINVCIVHPDTAFRYGLADRPWRISAVYPVEGRAEIEGVAAERIFGMAAWHICGQRRIFATHFFGWRPWWVRAFAGDFQDALPPVLAAWCGNWIDDRDAALRNIIEPSISEADDDLAGADGVRKVHHLPSGLVRGSRGAAEVPFPGENALGRGDR